MNIAAVIQENRRKKGLTQEQLADIVGVSAPAVSKWESGASCPDIALLAPLARALGVTIDGLLGFTATLTDEEVHQLQEECDALYRREGHEAGRAHCEALLHEYPNSNYLKICIAGIYQRFALTSKESETDFQRIYALYQQVYDSGDPRLREAVTVMLTAKALADGDTARAEQLLAELPKVEYSPDSLYPLLYLKKGEPERAIELLEKQIVTLGNQLGTALCSLTTLSAQQGDIACALACCRANGAMLEALQLRGMHTFLQTLELFITHGSHEEAVQAAVRYLESLREMGTDYSTHPFLSHIKLQPNPPQTASIQRTLLAGFEADESFLPLREDSRVQTALRRLRESIPLDS